MQIYKQENENPGCVPACFIAVLQTEYENPGCVLASFIFL